MHFTPTHIDSPVLVELATHRDERLLPMGVAEGCWLRRPDQAVGGGRHRTWSYHGHPLGAHMHTGQRVPRRTNW